ncbi:putative MFS family arabinose efflux permease [Planomicrobium soli]|uniref:Putative MFS family arabinose efflux permease n=1 Tax=Planomicrobium soli TaxID=1176648 RepID=A0A2P8H4C4_9BACL|nr:MFS transporter [Planomicrobium soli]PSL41064.1 putative MFS family arabinose efflux permease [Planomicrobium soli]
MKENNLIVFILTVGVFGILNTEMGFIGILPNIADQFGVSVATAGWLVSIFAIGVAISGPTMPLLFSRLNRKKVMVLVLSIFVAGNVISIFTSSFTVLLIARLIPALFHPVYVSLAFSVAANSVKIKDVPKAISKIFIGVSAGMVIGVPIASFMANMFNLQVALSFFAIVNFLVLISTLLFIPSIPVNERISYGSQLKILKKSLTWFSILTALLFNAAIFAVFSYLAEYLQTVTNVSANVTSFILLIYGAANVIGNIWAGKLLTSNPMKTMVYVPVLVGLLYIILFFTGQFTFPAAVLIFFWGILAGIGANLTQYVVSSAATEAPDFANGLFLSSVNIGTTVGAAAGGLFIASLGTSHVILAGIFAALLSLLFIWLRNTKYTAVVETTERKLQEKASALT